MEFRLTRWQASLPARRELLKAPANKTKFWENYDLAIALPGAPAATLYGKPRVSPRIKGRKGPNVANSTTILWSQVPMLVYAERKNYTRKFAFATKVSKAFVGNLTFTAVATGPNNALRTAQVVVPVVARRK